MFIVNKVKHSKMRTLTGSAGESGLQRVSGGPPPPACQAEAAPSYLDVCFFCFFFFWMNISSAPDASVNISSILWSEDEAPRLLESLTQRLHKRGVKSRPGPVRSGSLNSPGSSSRTSPLCCSCFTLSSLIQKVIFFLFFCFPEELQPPQL